MAHFVLSRFSNQGVVSHVRPRVFFLKHARCLPPYPLWLGVKIPHNSVALCNPQYALSVPIDRADVRRFIESKHPRLPNRETTTHNKTTSHPQQVADRKRNLSATSKSLYHAARSPCAPYALTHNTCLKRAQSKDRCPSVVTRHLHSRRWLFPHTAARKGDLLA